MFWGKYMQRRRTLGTDAGPKHRRLRDVQFRKDELPQLACGRGRTRGASELRWYSRTGAESGWERQWRAKIEKGHFHTRWSGHTAVSGFYRFF
jgi:hypothetical protein